MTRLLFASLARISLCSTIFIGRSLDRFQRVVSAILFFTYFSLSFRAKRIYYLWQHAAQDTSIIPFAHRLPPQARGLGSLLMSAVPSNISYPSWSVPFILNLRCTFRAHACLREQWPTPYPNILPVFRRPASSDLMHCSPRWVQYVVASAHLCEDCGASYTTRENVILSARRMYAGCTKCAHRVVRCVVLAIFVLPGHDVSVFVLRAGDIEVAV